MPLSLLVGNRDDVPIIEKNGIRLLTDSILDPIVTCCDGSSAYERGKAVTSNDSAKRRKTGHHAAGELCHSNSGRVPAHIGFRETRSRGRGNHEQQHHSSQLPGVNHADASVRTALSPYSYAVKISGAGGGQAWTLGHGQDAVAATTGAGSDDTRPSSAPKFAVQEPSLPGATSSTTFFQAIDANSQRRDGPTTPSRPEGADAGGEVCHSNSCGVLSPLQLLADVAGREHADGGSAQVSPNKSNDESLLAWISPPWDECSAVPRGSPSNDFLPCATESLINANLQRRDGLTGQDRVGGFCHGNLDEVLVQQASPLHLLADMAGRTGPVPTLGPMEPISGNPGSPDENAASPSQPNLLVGGGVESMEQPSASSQSNTSGRFTLPNGLCLPIACLKERSLINNLGHAAGTEGTGIYGDALRAPSGFAIGTLVSPECRDSVSIESPCQLQIFSEAAGQAERQAAAGNSSREKELDVFMDEVLSEAFHTAPRVFQERLSPSSSCSAGPTL
ncbi:hypothetical protein N658DRAFT_500095, partial [Parathielavia hyrcaniae]